VPRYYPLTDVISIDNCNTCLLMEGSDSFFWSMLQNPGPQEGEYKIPDYLKEPVDCCVPIE